MNKFKVGDEVRYIGDTYSARDSSGVEYDYLITNNIYIVKKYIRGFFNLIQIKDEDGDELDVYVRDFKPVVYPNILIRKTRKLTI